MHTVHNNAKLLLALYHTLWLRTVQDTLHQLLQPACYLDNATQQYYSSVCCYRFSRVCVPSVSHDTTYEPTSAVNMSCHQVWCSVALCTQVLSTRCKVCKCVALQ
jgi:hypothetical protein